MVKKGKIILLIFALCAFTALSGTCGKDPNCDQGCSVGNQDCTGCVDGFFVSNTNRYCYPCATANCAECSDRETCTSCKSGYKLNADKICVTIGTPVQKCTYYGFDDYERITCFLCSSGYYSTGTSCLTCPAQCADDCGSSSLCYSCSPGYFQKDSGCVACVSHCETCISSMFCQDCFDGYYLNADSGCSACPANCATCSSDTVCLSCKDQFWLSGSSCVACSGETGCTTCQGSADTCSKCNSGYRLNGGDCQACSTANCIQCDSSQAVCSQCSTGLTPQNSGANCLSCESFCTTCTSSTVCTVCKAEYIANAGDCDTCSSHINNCAECSSTSVCTKCKTNYYLNGATCSLCSTPMANCAECSASNVCTKCNTGFQVKVDKTGCIACTAITNCQTCTNEHICQKCNSDYYITKVANTADTCTKCTNLVGGQCLTCSADGECLSVAAGKYIASGGSATANCVDAVNNCGQCTLNYPTECVKCNAGYYLEDDLECYSCDGDLYGCNECDEPTKCTKCKTNFVLDVDKCVSCNSLFRGCSECENFAECKTCYPGYYLDSNNICRSCPTGCSACSLKSGKIQCSACSEYDPYIYNSLAKTCDQCDAGCNGCSGTTTTCTSCNLGYDPGTGSTCVKDTKCIQANCRDCGVTTDNYCTNCETGYFPINGECIQCTTNCKSCYFDIDTQFTNNKGTWDSALTAIENLLASGQVYTILTALDITNAGTQQLKQKYFLVYTAYKYLIDLGITNENMAKNIKTNDVNVAAIINNTTKTLAQKGDEIFAYISTTLDSYTADTVKQAVKESVLKKTSCYSCISGYFTQGSGCSVCSVLNCYTCSSSYECLSCDSGYYKSEGICKACLSTCSICSDGNTCDYCITGYQLNDNSLCIKCESPCLSCDGNQPDKCTSCIRPYSSTPNSNNKCFMCDQTECLKCSEHDPAICFQCASSYTLSNATCKACSNNCASCQVGVCQSCLTRYFLSNGACVACPDKCSYCTSATVCTSCMTGFYVSSTGGCASCSEGCAQCSSLETCTAYKSGITVYNGKVVECGLGCESCDSANPSICLKCKQSFYLSSSKCKACGKNCQTCTSPTACTACIARAHDAGDGTCEKCIGDCETCSADDLQQCLTCRRGFTLVGKVCVRLCSKGCAVCDTNPEKCDLCSEGYTLTATGKCAKCIGTCSGTCDPKNINTCTGCADGFYLSSNKCLRCTTGCASCSSATYCNICQPGFVLNSGVCSERCKYPCKECLGNTCKKCVSGFKLSNSVCIPDISCNPSCEYCPSGTYQQTNGNCIVCGNNCALCTADACTSCFEGFYLGEQSKCVACESSCKICSGSQNCEVCAAGYTRKIIQMNSISDIEFGESCQACSSECATCFLQPDYCLSCRDDKKLNGVTCISRRVVKFEYLFKENYADFLENTGIEGVITELCDAVGIQQNKVVLNAVSQGSIKVQGQISAESEVQAAAIKSTAETATFTGFTVQSSSFGVFYDDAAVPDSPTDDNPDVPTEEELNTTALIVGVVLGAVILIALLAFIVYKVKTSSGGPKKIADQDTASFQEFKRNQSH